jgi:hypothetical protein
MTAAMAFPVPVPSAPTGSLTERAMNVTLHLSAWGAQRVDQKTTAEVLHERQASHDAGRFEKYLVPPKALDAISKAHNHARTRHYKLTLPWGDEGVRILSSAAFFDYTSAMQEERSACENAYRDFCDAYPRLVADAPQRLGTKLFNRYDFPDVADIRTKFAFRLVVLPVPDKGDFRVALGSDVEAEIRASIEATITERFATAQRDLYERLLDAVKHFALVMKEDGKKFKDTTVHKLGELAKLAPKLSLTPDTKLDELCAEVLQLTNGIAPSDLRDNQLLRTHTARRAKATLDRIEDAMKGAF